MTTQSWTCKARPSIILESTSQHIDSGDLLFPYTVRIVMQSPAQIRKSLEDYCWEYTRVPGYGSCVDPVTRVVESAGSEEEAMLLAAAAGSPIDFIFKYGPSKTYFERQPLVEIFDVEKNTVLWKYNKTEV